VSRLSRLSRITAAALAVAAAAPALAAAEVELRGAPTLTQTGTNSAVLRFAVDERLPRTGLRIQVAGTTVRRATHDGRHGRDHVYRATVRTNRALQAGSRYTVRFRVGDDPAVSRIVRLRPAR
jgi:hypothetical protein